MSLYGSFKQQPSKLSLTQSTDSAHSDGAIPVTKLSWHFSTRPRVMIYHLLISNRGSDLTVVLLLQNFPRSELRFSELSRRYLSGEHSSVTYISKSLFQSNQWCFEDIQTIRYGCSCYTTAQFILAWVEFDFGVGFRYTISLDLWFPSFPKAESKRKISAA